RRESAGGAHRGQCRRGTGCVCGSGWDGCGDRDAGGYSFGERDGVPSVWREGGQAEWPDFGLRKIRSGEQRPRRMVRRLDAERAVSRGRQENDGLRVVGAVWRKTRSEERRVGKECRWRGGPDEYK